MARKADIKLLAIARDRHSPKEGMAQTVVNRILDLVRTGMLRAGDRLPSERELIDILDISRPTLREALRALSMLGVIDSRHGGGAFVTDLEARTLLAPLDFFLSLSQSNLADAFQSRRIVELEIVRMAAQKATAEQLQDLDAIIAAHEKIMNDPVGFRILGRHPEWADWLILQNTNAYEVGFTSAWDAIRHALWKKRSPDRDASGGTRSFELSATCCSVGISP